MAVTLSGILESRSFSNKRAPCGGQNSLSQKVRGRNSVRVCSSSNNNDGSVHSYNKNKIKNDMKKQTRRSDSDVVLPCCSYIDKGNTIKWWLPLFGWSHQERRVDHESKTKGMDKRSSEDCEKEMEAGAVPSTDSKIVRGRFTPEKAKLLRKNLRDTSTFHDAMYHSAIASRLASPDNEDGHGLHIGRCC